MNDADLSGAIRKTALVMAGPKKSHGAGRFEQASHRMNGGKDIFILVMICAMNHRQAIGVRGAGGQLRNISRVIRFELVAGPQRGNLRHRIEVPKVGEPRHDLVVIASDNEWV